jgi:antitoxin HicB
MAEKPKKYIVTDGELVLELEREGKWYCVTSPFNPEIITQARSLEEAFEMARDVIQTYEDYRAKKQTPGTEPAKAGKRDGKGAAKKTA